MKYIGVCLMGGCLSFSVLAATTFGTDDATPQQSFQQAEPEMPSQPVAPENAAPNAQQLPASPFRANASLPAAQNSAVTPPVVPASPPSTTLAPSNGLPSFTVPATGSVPPAAPTASAPSNTSMVPPVNNNGGFVQSTQPTASTTSTIQSVVPAVTVPPASKTIAVIPAGLTDQLTQLNQNQVLFAERVSSELAQITQAQTQLAAQLAETQKAVAHLQVAMPGVVSAISSRDMVDGTWWGSLITFFMNAPRWGFTEYALLFQVSAGVLFLIAAMALFSVRRRQKRFEGEWAERYNRVLAQTQGEERATAWGPYSAHFSERPTAPQQPSASRAKAWEASPPPAAERTEDPYSYHDTPIFDETEPEVTPLHETPVFDETVTQSVHVHDVSVEPESGIHVDPRGEGRAASPVSAAEQSTQAEARDRWSSATGGLQDEYQVKLNLARAYTAMQETDSALTLLEEVIAHGGISLRAEAESLKQELMQQR